LCCGEAAEIPADTIVACDGQDLRPAGTRRVPQGLHRIAALALADDGSVFVADTCLGFLVRLTRQAPP